MLGKPDCVRYLAGMSTGPIAPTPMPPFDDLPPTGPGSKTRRRAFLLGSTVVLIVLLVAARDVLLPFLLAIVLAYVLSPVVQWGERKPIFGYQPKRWIVVVTLYLLLVGGLVGLVTFSVPRLAAELGRLAREAPRVVAQARNEWIPEAERRIRDVSERYLGPLGTRTVPPELQPKPPFDGGRLDETAIQVRPRGDGGYEVALPSHGIRITPDGENAYRITPAHPQQGSKTDLTDALQEVLGGAMETTERSAVTLFVAARRIVVSLSRGIFGFGLMLMISAYILITSDRIFEFFRSLYRPTRRHEFDDLIRRLDRGLAGVVRGQLMICLVNGVLSGIGFYALGLKYWVFLTLIATVMSIIPIFGAVLSSVPAVVIALPQGIGLALLVVGWIIVIHQIEANFLNPKIMGDAAKVHPVLVIFALLTGEHLAGIVGALLAVPVLSICQTLFLQLRERFLGVPRGPSSFPPGALRAPPAEKPPAAPSGAAAAPVRE
jgi:predicted PurR-regulated permease PerM